MNYSPKDPDIMPEGRNLVKEAKLYIARPEINNPKIRAGAMELFRIQKEQRWKRPMSWKKCLEISFRMRKPSHTSYTVGLEARGFRRATELMMYGRDAIQDYKRMRRAYLHRRMITVTEQLAKPLNPSQLSIYAVERDALQEMIESYDGKHQEETSSSPTEGVDLEVDQAVGEFIGNL